MFFQTVMLTSALVKDTNKNKFYIDNSILYTLKKWSTQVSRHFLLYVVP
jgi:hypothetical protein